MRPLSSDLREFIHLLNTRHVKYMIVGAWADMTAEKAFTGALEREISDRRVKSQDELFADRDKLMTATMEAMMRLYVVREEKIGERPTHEVLRERLNALPWPEFRLLAAYITGHESPAIGFWKYAVEGESGEDGTP